MATPLTDSKQVATALMELLFKHHVKIPRKRIMAYMNAAGLTLTALPDSYLKALDDEIVKMLRHPFLREVRLGECNGRTNESIGLVRIFTCIQTLYSLGRLSYS